MVEGEHQVVLGVELQAEAAAEADAEGAAAEELAVASVYQRLHGFGTARAAAAADQRSGLGIEYFGERPVEDRSGEVVVEVGRQPEFRGGLRGGVTVAQGTDAEADAGGDSGMERNVGLNGGETSRQAAVGTYAVAVAVEGFEGTVAQGSVLVELKRLLCVGDVLLLENRVADEVAELDRADAYDCAGENVGVPMPVVHYP